MSVRMRAWDKGQDAESSEQKQTFIPPLLIIYSSCLYLAWAEILLGSGRLPGQLSGLCGRHGLPDPEPSQSSLPPELRNPSICFPGKSFIHLSWKNGPLIACYNYPRFCLLFWGWLVLETSDRGCWESVLTRRGAMVPENDDKKILKKHFEGLCSDWTRQRAQYDCQTKIVGTSEGERARWEQQRRGRQNNAAHCAVHGLCSVQLCTAR